MDALITPKASTRLRHVALGLVLAIALLAAELEAAAAGWILLGLLGSVAVLALSVDPRWLYRMAYPGVVVLAVAVAVPTAYAAYILGLAGAVAPATGFALIALAATLLGPEEGSRWLERRSREEDRLRRT
ncbi:MULTISPECIES: hypothetical protein [unclassified Thioalkalivibrio]|uniref:hypothetical protein n=1 Tax=unclassified Thioalkalivibrio TaxID=2621013 RepID=UPI0003815240|nr:MULTISPECIES: hypothetical protein [unclassified Thioalkalivibrio]